MGYKTHLIPTFRIPATNQSEETVLVDSNGIYSIDFKVKPNIINNLTVVIEGSTGFIVPSILEYLVHRHHKNKRNSSFESRALRLYFDFLEYKGLMWDSGSHLSYERPISQFAAHLEVLNRKSLIAATTGANYFNSVCRFYKYYLKLGYQFKGLPIEFTEIKIKKYDNDMLSHINGLEINLEVASCKPNLINTTDARPLKPFSSTELTVFLNLAIEKESYEFALICITAMETGLRASELADLRVDMISKFASEDFFTLAVGPQVSHKTKFNKDGWIDVPSKIIKILLAYNKSQRYLKRLEKCPSDRPNVFLNKNGNPYDQHTISSLFNGFMHNYVIPVLPDFDHKFHDLRVTFGVLTAKACIKAGMNRNEILATTKNQMRHKNITTTLHYLEHWQASVAVKQRSDINEKLLGELYNKLNEISANG